PYALGVPPTVRALLAAHRSAPRERARRAPGCLRHRQAFFGVDPAQAADALRHAREAFETAERLGAVGFRAIGRTTRQAPRDPSRLPASIKACTASSTKKGFPPVRSRRSSWSSARLGSRPSRSSSNSAI